MQKNVSPPSGRTQKCCKIKSQQWSLIVFACVCVCVPEGERKPDTTQLPLLKSDAIKMLHWSLFFFFLRWDVWISISPNISLFLLIRLCVVFMSKVSLLWHAAWAYLDQAVMQSSGWGSPALTLNVSNAVCSRGKNSMENLPSGGLREIISGHLCGPSVRIEHFWAADLPKLHCVWIWLISTV